MVMAFLVIGRIKKSNHREHVTVLEQNGEVAGKAEAEDNYIHSPGTAV